MRKEQILFMTFIFLVVLAMVIVFFQTGIGETFSGSISEHSNDNQVLKMEFQDIKGGYKFRYPSDWSIEDHSFKEELIRADLYFGEMAGIQIRLQDKTDIDNDIFADFYFNNYKNEMIGHWQGTIIKENYEKGMFGCCPGYQYDLIIRKADNSEWLLKLTLWFDDRFVHIFQGGVNLDQRSKLEPSLNEIISSFEIIH